MEAELIPEEPSHKKGRHRKKQLYNSILQQMEFYFSDSNLAKDRFLSQMMQTSPDIELSVFLKFNKLRKLTTSIEDITKAVSKSQLIQLSDDKTKIRRKLPVKVKHDVDDCTIYVERLKSDATHDWLKSIFIEFGNVVYVSIPKYKHNGMIKGFGFVEFENQEGAKTAMQYFESIDCKIPSDIEPQKLCSIATFTPNLEGENRIVVKVPEFNENLEEAVNIKEEVMEEEDVAKTEVMNIKSEVMEEEEVAKTEETEPPKKRKHSDTIGTFDELEKVKKKKVKVEDEVEVKVEETVEEVVVKKKKRKHSESEAKEDEEDKEEEESGEKKKTKTEEEGKDEASESNKILLPETTASDGEGDEKKKKKHKKSNRKKINLKEIGLQILCKKDWKKMRNRYLEMQRKTMKQLKMHLNRQRFSNRYGNKKLPHQAEKNSNPEMEVVKENQPIEESSQFIPGTIVKVSLLEPCDNNKKLKTEFKDLPHEIKYVDIPLKFGSEEIFVRFSDNANAQAFCASSFSKGKPSILEGDEEKTYWEKIEMSRQDKLKKCFGKQRGRDKLLKKAERQAAKHVRFDDSE